MHITLFGGSFNPPHLGHVVVIEQAFELIPKLDELWLLPDYQHSFAKNQNLIDTNHRLAMTRMLEREKVRTETCTIDRKMSGSTIEHITYLQKTYPSHTFSFLMGNDNLKTFTKWEEWQKLLELMPFYIYPRANLPMEPLYPNMYPLEHPLQTITNLSSTTIRNRINQNLPFAHLVPTSVLHYIKTNRLYTHLT